MFSSGSFAYSLKDIHVRLISLTWLYLQIIGQGDIFDLLVARKKIQIMSDHPQGNMTHDILWQPDQVRYLTLGQSLA